MRIDFIEGMLSTGINDTMANRILNRFQKYQKKWNECIDNSFITDEQKTQYQSLIAQRLDTLNHK